MSRQSWLFFVAATLGLAAWPVALGVIWVLITGLVSWKLFLFCFGCSLCQVALRQIGYLVIDGRVMDLPLWAFNENVMRLLPLVLIASLGFELILGFWLAQWWVAILTPLAAFIVVDYIIVSKLFGELNPMPPLLMGVIVSVVASSLLVVDLMK